MQNQNQDTSILVCQINEINLDSKMIVSIKKPQVIHMNTYDIHLLFNKININTVIYYINRFQIDYLALDIPLTKYISIARQMINCLRKENSYVRIICTGDAITQQIAKDIGADGFTKDGDDFTRVIEALDK